MPIENEQGKLYKEKNLRMHCIKSERLTESI